MAGRHRIPKKDLEFMAKDIGPELLPFIEPEEVFKHLSLEDWLRGLNVEERRTLKQLWRISKRVNTAKVKCSAPPANFAF